MNNDLLRENLFRYASGEITLREFKEWFFPAAWECELPLVRLVKIRLAEQSTTESPEEELKMSLLQLASTFRIGLNFDFDTEETGSQNVASRTTMRVELIGPAPVPMSEVVWAGR